MKAKSRDCAAGDSRMIMSAITPVIAAASSPSCRNGSGEPFSGCIRHPIEHGRKETLTNKGRSSKPPETAYALEGVRADLDRRRDAGLTLHRIGQPERPVSFMRDSKPLAFYNWFR